MTIADLYRKLKQILADSNIALASRGLEQVDSLMEIPERLTNGGGRLALLVSKEIAEITAEDLEGVVNIPNYAFSNCLNLTSVTIPNGIEEIYKMAFYRCKNLVEVILPESVWFIDDSAFSECFSYIRVHTYSIRPPSLGTSALPKNAQIYVPEGCLTVYKNNEDWKNFNITERK
jgi:hypothetical protein